MCNVDIEDVEAMWWFGTLPLSKLAEVACDLLEAGYDTEPLRQIAGLSNATKLNIEKMFEQALAGLGRSKLSRDEAGHRLAIAICREIVSGRLAPYEGARKIWWEIWENQRSLDQLRTFVGLASEYEDDATHRDEYAEDILREARKMLDNGNRAEMVSRTD